MCYDDYECVDITSGWRRARKEHVCFACKETVRPGDQYHRTVQAYEGTAEAFVHCARCWAMVQAVVKVNGSCQWDLHCGQDWADAHGPVPEDVARLAFLTPDEAQALAPVRR